MTDSCLSLSHIKIKRSGRFILDIDDLQINSGQFVGVIGTNGAGKTTLLKLCCGLIKPTEGTVKFKGVDFNSLNAWKKTDLRKSIGYIPQTTEYNAELPFTLREVVAMGRAGIRPLFTSLNSEDYDYVDNWIEKVGLSGQRNQTFRTLSGGEQQKTLIARAMTQQPSILMLDEPCANLDIYWKYHLVNIIDQLYRQTNITVLMISHETNLLPSNAKRIILLHEGKILADGDSDDVFNSSQINKAYRCRIEIVNIDGRKYTVSKSPD